MFRPIFVFVSAAFIVATTPPGDAELDNPSPRDDFYTFVNAEWLRTAEIPSEVPWISPFVVNTLRVQEQVRKLIVETAAKPSPANGVGSDIAAFHRSFTNDGAVETAELTPLHDVFADIRSASTAEHLAPLFGRLASEHTDFDANSLAPSVAPVAIGVWNDRLDATSTALVLSPSGLGLPDRAY